MTGVQTCALPIYSEDFALVLRRPTDNLPPHVKGNAFWKAGSKGFEDHRGYYVWGKHPHTGHDLELPIEFIRHQGSDLTHWYSLEQIKGSTRWYTDNSRQIPIDNTLELGWWNPNDPQHPEHSLALQTGPSSPSCHRIPTR